VGIQNEITQPGEVWKEMTSHLRKALDSNGFANVKIHMHNAVTLQRGANALAAFSSGKDVWKNIDYTASNLYDYQNHFTNPDGFSKMISQWKDSLKLNPVKPFLSVEMCVNDAKYQSGSYKIAFLMGVLYHKNMVELNAVSLMYCWLLINTVQPSFAASRSLFTINKKNNSVPVASSYQLRVFGAFSRHLLKKFQRIEVVSSDAELLVSAYLKGNKQILILLNRGTAAKKINLYDFTNQFSGMEMVSPYHNNEKYAIPVSKQIIIEPGSIVTLL
jgi:hypothetical protein